MENQQYIQEDEIDLRDYVNVVIKRKKLILVIFLVSIVAAVAASLLMPKVYEITSTVQLGSVNDVFTISKEKAREIILNRNSLLSIIKELNLKIEPGNLRNNIKVNFIENTNLFTIKISYPGLDMVFKIYNTLMDSLMTQGQSIYEERLAVTSEWLKELEQEIDSIEVDMDKAQTLISGMTDIRNRTILSQNISSYENNLIALKEQRNKLKLTLITTKNFEIFDAPIMPKKPIRPNMEQNVLIAGIIGLAFGAFLAFFMESWQKSKD